MEAAEKIVRSLVEAGHTAYYAGGWVRDKLLGLPSDDIDIATSATPPQVTEIFEKVVPVGIEFGSVVVVIDDHPFEVTTFRTDLGYKDGRHPTEIAFSSPEEDAKRRSITINGMFYNPLTDTVHDFIGGKADLEAGIIRAIGDPLLRFEEDKLRMIRAVRFSTRFNFSIEEKTAAAIRATAHALMGSVAIERVWKEFTKVADLQPFITALYDYSLLQQIFPDLKALPPLDHLIPAWPTILALLELFPHDTLDQKIERVKRLKVSNADQQLARLMHTIDHLDGDPSDWAALYANPNGPLCISLLALRKPATFANHHQKEQERLAAHISRLKQKRPLVTSAHLAAHGVGPGPTMGRLLAQAQQIAINKDLSNPDQILSFILPNNT